MMFGVMCWQLPSSQASVAGRNRRLTSPEARTTECGCQRTSVQNTFACIGLADGGPETAARLPLPNSYRVTPHYSRLVDEILNKASRLPSSHLPCVKTLHSRGYLGCQTATCPEPMPFPHVDVSRRLPAYAWQTESKRSSSAARCDLTKACTTLLFATVITQ
jgi:hypothetical protein